MLRARFRLGGVSAPCALSRITPHLLDTGNGGLLSNDLAQARRIADNVVCLQQGEVAWRGSARDLFENHRESVLEPLYGGELL